MLRIFTRINEAKCMEAILWIVSALLGTAITIFHVVPLVTDSWIYVVEPRPANITNEFGEQLDVAFIYSMGYFRICREYQGNVTSFESSVDPASALTDEEISLQCNWNPFFTGFDLSEYSTATVAIQERLGMPTLVYFLGVIVCLIAFYFGTIGFAERDFRTLLASMVYTCGGFFILVSVLQFICVVDDEMTPRMRPTAFGEASKFSYQYGYSFYFSSLSFLPLQMCICFHAFLYFRRFPNAVDKIKIVPGLERKFKEIEKEYTEVVNPLDGISSSSQLPQPASASRKHSLVTNLSLSQEPTSAKNSAAYVFADAV